MNSNTHLIIPQAATGPLPLPPINGAVKRTASSNRPQQSGVSHSDPVDLSQEGIRASQNNGDISKSAEANTYSPNLSNRQNLSAEELLELNQLKSRDAEVRAHEQAHLSTAGQYAAGGASFTYQVGPDGRRYAVGGEVPISISKENTPEETIQKMQVVARAALAPASPSTADRRIAARAAALAAQARSEIQQESLQQNEDSPSPLNEVNTDSDQSFENSVNSANSVDNESNVGSSISPNARQMILEAYRAQAT